MAQLSGAFGVNGGFNQSGGGYYITISSIVNEMKSYTPGSGSGGATTVGTFGAYWTGSADGAYSTLVGASRTIKDMGKTIVSAGRTFRKFAAVGIASTTSTFGTVGSAASTTNPGYLTFYLETGLPSVGINAGQAPVPIARYAF